MEDYQDLSDYPFLTRHRCEENPCSSFLLFLEQIKLIISVYALSPHLIWKHIVLLVQIWNLKSSNIIISVHPRADALSPRPDLEAYVKP